ncbi:MAG: MFS transporter [Nitrososphaeria archaeon]
MKIEKLGLTRNIVLISSTVAVLNFGFIVSTSLVLLYLNDVLLLDSFSSGLIVTLARLSAAIVTLPAGSFADRFGRKYPIILGFSLCSLFLFITSLTSNYLIASASIIIVFSGVAFSGPATSALVSEASVIGRTALGFGWYYAIYSLSQFVGQTLSGVFIEFAGYQTTFFVGSAFSTVSLVLAWKFVHERWSRKGDFTPSSFAQDFKIGIAQLREKPKLANLTVGLSLHGLGVNMWLTFIPLYASHDQGFDPMAIGVILSLFSISGAIFQIPFGIVTDKVGGNRILFLHVLLSSAIWWAYPLLDSFLLALLYMFSAGIIGSMDLPARRSLLSFISEEKFATAVGSLDSITQIVGSIGPFIAGMIWSIAHWAPFAVSAIVNILGLLTLHHLPVKLQPT